VSGVDKGADNDPVFRNATLSTYQLESGVTDLKM
jgi:hypothetical protein